MHTYVTYMGEYGVEKEKDEKKKICVNVFLYPSVFRSNFPIQLCTVNL